ncbi:DUF1702 family protein [Paenibacillus sp. SYP-B4298]|uniref:DUF1702 family protein n=1 Tax=Paenibacillus sp. SYP-B4298 TaxID=2996034 RepID=UPI0022DDBAF5|nr:DUF1702 family protein [Paenibacillus sp. SYP-B4298]
MILIGMILLIIIAVLMLPSLYLSMFRQHIPRMQQRFQKGYVGDIYSRRFPRILEAFLTGNNRVLKRFWKVDEVYSSLNNDFGSFYRGFAFEGAGMGLAVQASRYYGRAKRFEGMIHALSPHYIYQYYVGLGWYLNIRYGYRYSGYKRWVTNLTPRYASILFDGVGFRAALFRLEQDPLIHQKFERFPFSYSRVCYQGFGRGLWFVNRFQLPLVVNDIQQLPMKYRNDAYSGLGLAVAYSFFDNMAFAIRAESLITKQHRPAFRQGVAFGWEARRLHDIEYWAAQLSRYPDTLSNQAEWYIACVHQAREMDDEESEQDLYTAWMDRTRALLAGEMN